eukprot:m51a1_g116 hypothetical protein (475) ;mRNA; f:356578-358700
MDNVVLETVESVMALRGGAGGFRCRAPPAAAKVLSPARTTPPPAYSSCIDGGAPADDPAGSDAQEALPGDVLVGVFRYLDIASLSSAALVSRSWRAAMDSEELWRDKSGSELQSMQDQLHVVNALLDVVARKAFSERSSYERLDFLRGTVGLIQTYVHEQLRRDTWRAAPRQRFVYVLFGSVRRQLQETARMLGDLNAGSFAITVNFDIFDLALRRYYEEAAALVPIDSASKTGTAELITDREARQNWEAIIGAGVCYAHFDVFYQRLVRKVWPDMAADDRFARHLSHYVNFPRDNILTTYRFNVLLSLFGPFRLLANNFQRFVLCPGFLGLINMIKAEEILVQLLPQLRRNTVLIRFSRRQPEFLAFTSIDVRSGRVEHRRNVDREGRSVPIAKYLERAFPGYDLVRMGVDDMATRFETTFTFARYSNPYTYSEYPVLDHSERSFGAPCWNSRVFDCRSTGFKSSRSSSGTFC